MDLHTENVGKKKNISHWKYTDRIIPSVFVEYAVNILQLSVQY
jgi:hypothetical protein